MARNGEEKARELGGVLRESTGYLNQAHVPALKPDMLTPDDEERSGVQTITGANHIRWTWRRSQGRRRRARERATPVTDHRRTGSAGPPGFRSTRHDLRKAPEVAVGGAQYKIVLHDQSGDPEIVGRNGSALATQLKVQLRVVVRGLLVRQQYRHP